MNDCAHNVSYLYGDREFRLSTDNIFEVTPDAVVCESDEQLAPVSDLARAIHHQGGELIHRQCRQLTAEYGSIDTGMAVFTDAGNLPCSGVVHVVSPGAANAEAREEIGRAVSRSLLLCETNGWHSIVFPALGLSAGVSMADCACGIHRAVTHYWDARLDSSISLVILYLALEQVPEVRSLINGENQPERETETTAALTPSREEADLPVGVVELDPDQTLDSPDIDNWFK